MMLIFSYSALSRELGIDENKQYFVLNLFR